HAEQPDLAVRPGLYPRPFDGVIEVARLHRRHHLVIAGGLAHAARVDDDHGVARQDPALRIRHFPGQIFAGRAVAHDLGMVAHDEIPIALEVDGDVAVLAIGRVGDDRRYRARPV